MNSKSGKGKEEKKQTSYSQKEKGPSKAKKSFEEDDDELDEWEKPSVEDEFDPDFEEFDLPKPKNKSRKGKSAVDDFELDDDFRDMEFFNDTNFDDEDDDDLF